ncbi:MAG: hypothetical protein GY922_18470 [Proteobacteria bacterium]|nr:hypothetical protein [Pseudomonadota bacterium]
MKNIRAALLIGLCAAFSVSASAFVLNSIEVQSNLYEPLAAKISVSELSAGITDDLIVALASREAHQAAGIVYDEILGEFEFSLDSSSQPFFIHIHTARAISLPFIRFLVQLTLGEQQVFRDYTIMLDPVVINNPDPIATESETIAATLPLLYPGDRFGPVERGDTLMQIARSVEASSMITVKQKMVALIDENPDAFIDGNMNLMRQGAILRIPSERSMAALDKNKVANIYETQLLTWTQRSAQDEDESSSTEGWTAADLAIPDTEESALTGQSYVLRIVSPNGQVVPAAGSTSSASTLGDDATESSSVTGMASTGLDAPEAPQNQQVDDLRNRLGAVEEAFASKTLENDTLNRQISLLESQLEKTMKLIELQESQLALAQQQLDKMTELQIAERQKIEQLQSYTLSKDSEAMDSQQILVVEDVVEDGSDDPNNQLSDSVNTSNTPERSIESDPQFAVTEDSKVTPAAPWRDPSQTLDWMKDRALWLYGLAGTLISTGWGVVERNTGPLLMDDSAVSFGLLVIVLLLILWLIRRRRTQRYLSSDSEAARVPSAARRSVFQDSVPGDSQGSQPVVPTVVEDSIGAGFVTELETQRGVAVTSDEVDPLTEAEIYIAYGRSSQAEKILRDAISRFPNRLELKLKLLEALQTLDKFAEFNEMMTSLIQEVDKDSAEFAHLQALSKKIKAEPAPISGTSGNHSTVDSSSSLDIDSAAIEEGSPGSQSSKMDLQEIEFEIESASDIHDSELIPAPSRTGRDDTGPESGEGDISFEIASEVESDDVISFEGLSEQPKRSEENLDSFVLTDEPGASDQLDLAQACIQIGDEEGARHILQALVDGEDKESAEKALRILKTL